MKLSLIKKFYITVFITAAASLLFVWIILRPKYEASILTERREAIHQLQKSSIDILDNTIAGWSIIPRFIISRLIEKPNEGESILQIMMMLHPEIIQINIHSSGPSDELMSRNTSYPSFNLNLPDSIWEHSKVDSMLQITWLNRTDMPMHLLAMQMRFQVRQMPFSLTVIWDAKRISDKFAGLPFDKDYSVCILSPSGVVASNNSSFKLDGARISMDTSNTVQFIREGTLSWRVFTSAFRSAQFWMVIAVPDNIFTKPVEDFLLFSGFLITAPMLITIILGWLLSRQEKHFLNKMETSDSNPAEQ